MALNSIFRIAPAAMGLCLALGLGLLSCKATTKPPAADEIDLVLAAIETQGGVAALKKASAFSASYQATVFNTKIKGKVKHKAGASRVEYVAPNGDPVTQVTADGKCWQRIGRVVVPCLKALSEHSTRLARLSAASWLWPLTVGAALKAKPAAEGLTILGAGGEEVGTLLLDTTSYMVTGMKMQTSLMGKPGELRGTFSEVERHCGVQMPTKREFTFAGKPLLTEKIDGIICESVENATFEPPEQVKHGTVVIKHAFNTPLACTKLKGPLTGVAEALGQVTDYIVSKDLLPQGAAVLVHRKGPPSVRKPAQYVTDVCLPVSKQVWVMPKSDWAGTFFLGEVFGDEVLAAYGLGDHVKLSEELPPLLLDGAKKRTRKPSGVMYQTLYMPPGDIPAEQRVSEMILYLE